MKQIKIIKNPKGTIAKDFKTNPTGTNFVEIIYGKVNKFSRFLPFKSKKIIKLPKGSKIISIENNKPKIRQVTITYDTPKKK